MIRRFVLGGVVSSLLLVAGTSLAQQPEYCVQDPYGTPPLQTPFLCSRAGDTKGQYSANPADGPSLNWPGRAATFVINQDGSVNLVPNDAYIQIRQAFRAWATIPGVDFTFTDGGLTSSHQVGYDFLHLDTNQNVIMFQENWTHGQQVIGLTTATFNADSGEIFDADIELNDQDYVFTIGDGSVQTDLLNTITHEVGHFVGFDHPDKPGSPLPVDCTDSATMSAHAHLGETSKRVLAPSDVLGMTFVYPSAGPQGFCFAAVSPTSGPAPVITEVAGCHSLPASQLATLLLAFGVLPWLFHRAKKAGAKILVSAKTK